MNEKYHLVAVTLFVWGADNDEDAIHKVLDWLNDKHKLSFTMHSVRVDGKGVWDSRHRRIGCIPRGEEHTDSRSNLSGSNSPPTHSSISSCPR